MKILVTGANGFLGYYLCNALLTRGYLVVATGRGDCRLPYLGRPGFSYVSMDLVDHDQTRTVVHQIAPDFIFHAAAIGKPDDCELNKELATKINTAGSALLLALAAKSVTPFCYISTDFVFDGKAGNYVEEDLVNPVNHYGFTKAQAEKLVTMYAGDWSIVRTVLVYGRPMTGRSNLLSIVQEKLSRGQTYAVVDDQIRTPTYVEDLVNGLLLILEKRATGIYHLSGEEVLTPYQMAVETANYLVLDPTLLIRTTSAAFKQPAIRPLITGLDINKSKRELGFKPRRFAAGLQATFCTH
ncbi:MAG: SDR family oxidoreductase [Bacteroidetes bacterium]|nr:SDR family oxidoreductase [Bacteroidota bacterium]